ncbi:general secretion pathway protein GspD [Aquimarina sp. TRL1]|uniref:type II secretion system protein GspD n=1 Tax=Aquimarina sp. (strain TRL1) TaxID=2736252 RepID=UPI0015894B5C|nr:general secretion pathway protein GspD [Aquimarina sp. TRL1]QKX04094.1 general secretion pathway protein GspD [Aquimarina sp. TRL1]
MKIKQLILIFALTVGVQVSAQVDFQNQGGNNSRISNIENKLELLNVDIPGLTEKVNVNISNTSLLNFLRAVSQVHKININLSNELNNIPIINGFNDVTVQDLLMFLVKEYQLDIAFTGNILSIKKYVLPVVAPTEKKILVAYDVLSTELSIDLNNDPLSKVFRKITEVSGKNLLFTPELNDKNLNFFIKNVSFDVAMKKMAEANDLDYNKTKDGFYEFTSFEQAGKSGSKPASYRLRRSNFSYKVIDTLAKRVSVDLKNTPVSNVIYTLSEDLKLDVFIASPLENAGNVTVKAESISFDELLSKIFESNIVSGQIDASNQEKSNTYNGQQNIQNNLATTSKTFTFKREGNVYYFGTEDQLSLKKIEMVQMMHRSIVMLGDANYSGSGDGASNFPTGGVNYISGGSSTGINRNQRSSSFRNRKSSSSNEMQVSSISEIFPITVTTGLDIKIDAELNSFIVSGSGTQVEKFKKFIKYIDKPIPLILIEVMILEVNRSATLEAGVEFGIGKEPVTTEGTIFPNANITLGASTINRVIGGFDGFGSLNLGNVVPNFYMDIKAMESNGNVKILSTPKLSTLNGHKAYLSSGQTTYYAVTNQNFFGSQIPQTSEVVNYLPIDAELALEFKPFVSGDGQITLDIQVIQSSFSGKRIAENAPPDINSRKFSSIMRMRANDVAILGGIEQKVKNDSGSGVPLLSRIPILKWLFSKRKREDSKKKLNVIIKPTVFY